MAIHRPEGTFLQFSLIHTYLNWRCMKKEVINPNISLKVYNLYYTYRLIEISKQNINLQIFDEIFELLLSIRMHYLSRPTC